MVATTGAFHLAFFGPIGPGELILILLIVFIIFGAGKLPQIGEALGKGIRNFKKSSSGKDFVDVTPKKIAEPSSAADTVAPKKVEKTPTDA